MITSLDAFLVIVAFLVMAGGLARRFSLVRRGRKDARRGNPLGLLRYLIGHRNILRYRRRGLAHVFVFWGLILPLVAMVAAQFRVLVPAGVSMALSLVLDLTGMALAPACLFFLLRHFGKKKEERREGVVLPVILLFLVLCSGFLAEGVRLSIEGRSFSWASPVGSLLSAALPASPLFMQGAIRFHFLGVLVFIALLPFTFMRHIAAGALNVYYRKPGSQGQMEIAPLAGGTAGAGVWKDFSWNQLLEVEACVSCGRCEDNCPATLSGKILSPKRVIHKILEHMEAGGPNPDVSPLREIVSDAEIWACTACLGCVEHCPVYVRPLDKILEMRRYRVLEEAELPGEAKPLLRNLEIYGDVYGKGVAHRGDWAYTQDLPISPREAEVLLWVGCSGAFHPRYEETAKAMVKILRAADVSFTLLGKEELCCGDPARRLGEESLFQELALKNIAHLKEVSFQKIVTLCPHCFNVLKNEYPALGGEFSVLHASEYIAGLIDHGRISLKYALPARITVHDPCYLGRANGMYGPLRKVLRAVPGAQFVELPRSGAGAFCCGGGGGHMWLHERGGTRINTVRADEIRQTGVQVVGTACPYCLTMLEDGIKSLETGKAPKIMDLVEVVAASIR